jgi:hypothetical protein
LLHEWATAPPMRAAGLTTDGPFVAIKEALGGFLVFETDDLDAALELAGRIVSWRPARGPWLPFRVAAAEGRRGDTGGVTPGSR